VAGARKALGAVQVVARDIIGDGGGNEAGNGSAVADPLSDVGAADGDEGGGDADCGFKISDFGLNGGRQGITARSLGCARDDRLGRVVSGRRCGITARFPFGSLRSLRASLGCARDDRLGRVVSGRRQGITARPFDSLRSLRVTTDRAGENSQGRQGDNIRDAVPGVKERQVVLADEKENCGVRGKGVGKMLEGEEGVGRRGAADFAVGDGKRGDGLGRQFAHPQPMLRGGRRVARTMNRRRRGNQIQPVQPEMAAGVLGGDEVPEVDRVERAAEDADACRGHGWQYGSNKFKVQGSTRLR